MKAEALKPVFGATRKQGRTAGPYHDLTTVRAPKTTLAGSSSRRRDHLLIPALFVLLEIQAKGAGCIGLGRLVVDSGGHRGVEDSRTARAQSISCCSLASACSRN